MLGKLLKQEWKALTKVLLPANLLLIIITVIGRLVVRPLTTDAESSFLQVLTVFMLTFYIILLIAVTCGAFIYIVVRFYRTMYSDEGYLTHTLPLTVHQLIIGKGLAASGWLIITYCLAAVNVLFLIFGAGSGSEWAQLRYELDDVISEYNRFSSTPFGFLIFMIIFMMIVSAIYSFLNLSASMAVGQLFHNHKVIGSILAYFGFYFIIQLFSIVTMSSGTTLFHYAAGSMSSTSEIINYVHTVLGFSTILSLFLCVVFYFVTYYFTKRKLNLD